MKNKLSLLLTLGITLALLFSSCSFFFSDKAGEIELIVRIGDMGIARAISGGTPPFPLLGGHNIFTKIYSTQEVVFSEIRYNFIYDYVL